MKKEFAVVLSIIFAVYIFEIQYVHADSECCEYDKTKAKNPDLNLEEKGLVDGVREMLPSGWNITRVQKNVSPDSWCSLDQSGLMVEYGDGKQSCRIWFMPRAWIGIQTPSMEHFIRVQGKQIFFGTDKKIFTDCREPLFWRKQAKQFRHEQAKIGSLPWQRAVEIFSEKESKIDQEIEQLLEKCCSDEECKTVAADSMISIGVPSKKTYIRCAIHGVGNSRQYCVSVLKYIGDKDSFRVLRQILEDPDTEDASLSMAAFGLAYDSSRNDDNKNGHALMTALSNADNVTVAESITDSIIKFNYRPAAPLIFDWFKKHKQFRWIGKFIHALALLRYDEARPLVREVCKDIDLSVEKMFARHGDRVEVGFNRWSKMAACIRYLGKWGKTVGGVRVQLISPECFQVEEKIRMIVMVENGSREAIPYPTLWSGSMFVDGKPHPLDDGSPRAYIGSLSMDKSELRIFIIELPKRFEKPGKHRTQYKWTFCYIDREKLKLRRTSAKETFEGSSNEVEISISDNCGLN